MALTHVGTTRAAGPATAALPAGVVAGDLLTLLITNANPASLTGWTKAGADTTNNHHAAFYRIATGSGDAPGATGGGDQTLSAWRPISGTTVVATGNFAEDTIGAGASLDIPGVSHSFSQAAEIVMSAAMHPDAINAVTGFTTIDSATISSGRRSNALLRNTSPPSPTGTVSITDTNASTSAGAWGQQFIVAVGTTRSNRMLL